MTDISFSLTPLAILLVFYLYMLTRFKYVRRPMFYLWGAIAVAVGMSLVALLAPWVDPRDWLYDVLRCVSGVASVVAFACMVLACYGGELPEQIPQGRRSESMDEDELPEYLEEASQMQQRDG
jgi:hypothetical protein